MQARKVVGHAILLWKRGRVRRFLAQTHRLPALQHRILAARIARHAGSDFGRKHHFRAVRGVADFRRQVPLSDYSYFEPYIERVRRGDFGALFGPGTRVLMFALTSGTTAAAKYIPITDEFLKEYRRSWELWGIRVFDDHPGMRDAHILQLTSDWDQFRTEAGIPCGNISGLAAGLQSRITRSVYCVPVVVAKIADPVARYYVTLRLALARRNVGMAMTANPSTLLLIARLGDERKEDLVRDLADGTVTPNVELSSSIRHLLRRRLTRKARWRAQELEAIIERTGRLYPKDYWPALALIATWTGGSVGPYLRQFPAYYGEVPIRDHGLSASEGRMTIPFQDYTSAGILDVTSHYYEFIPQQEHGRPDPTVLEAHELREGESYFIILTTSSGLYRYDIQDVVRCVGFEGRAPVLEFLNKGAHFSSLTGEKLSEFQVVEAVRRSLDELKLTLEMFTVAPVWDDPPYYQLLVEEQDLAPLGCGTRAEDDVPASGEQAAGAQGASTLRRLIDRVETHLRAVNVEYENRRQTRRLGPLRLGWLAPGTWRRLRAQRLARGGSLEQYKHPCLVADLQFAAQLKTATLDTPAGVTMDSR